MPESAECKKIAELLAEKVSSKKLLKIELISGKYTKKYPVGYESMNNILPIKIIGAGVHGKFLFIILDGGLSVWNTLGLSGYWSELKTKSSRIALHIENTILYFNDTRGQGTVSFSGNKKELINKLESFGPDIATSNISDSELKERLLFMKSEKTIAQALMDQCVIAGIGNRIKSESLYRARISPHRLVKNINDDEFSLLNTSIKHIVDENYALKSKMTMNDFGEKNNKYNEDVLVYLQQEDIYGHEVVKEKTKDGRNTYWVPQVQK